MAQNADGTANCDRCRILLPGFGVIYGMVCNDLNQAGAVVGRIYCYQNNCRSIVMAGLLTNIGPSQNPQLPACSDCGLVLNTRGVAEAMLATDIQPGLDTPRLLTFCYANGSRDRLVANAQL